MEKSSSDFRVFAQIQPKTERASRTGKSLFAVHLLGKSGEAEVFKKTIGEGFIPKNFEEMRDILSGKEWTLIPLKHLGNLQEAEKLAPHEVVAVRIEDLIKLGIDANDIQDFTQELEIGTSPSILRMSIEIKKSFEKEEVSRNIKESLLNKWSQPIEAETLRKVNEFVTNHPKISLTETQRELLLEARTEGSFTIEEFPEKKEDWLRGEAFIRKKAEKGEKLTIEDLCKLNALLFGDEAEEMEAGLIRDCPVYAGGRLGSLYVSWNDVSELLHDLLDWVEEGVIKCKEGKENPLVLAALTYQRFVSIHPFSDGNGRTGRLVMDYVLHRTGLPPPSLGEDVEVAIFGDQDVGDPQEIFTPTYAVERVLDGMIKTYDILSTS